MAPSARDFLPMGKFRRRRAWETKRRGRQNGAGDKTAREEEETMPGPRMPLAVLEANGKKHLSEAEKAERAAQEVKLPRPKKISPPSWLPEYLKGDFRKLAKELLEADMGAAGLDRDTIGRYLVAQRQYTAAARHVSDALDAEDVEEVAAWGKEQERCFKQCRACAADMGLTISSRCRLVLLPKKEAAETNPFLTLMEGRRDRA